MFNISIFKDKQRNTVVLKQKIQVTVIISILVRKWNGFNIGAQYTIQLFKAGFIVAKISGPSGNDTMNGVFNF